MIQFSIEPVTFFLASNGDHIQGAIGVTPTVTLSKNNEPFAAGGGTVTEVGNGWYYYTPTTLDTGIAGTLKFHVEATGADPLDFEKDIEPYGTASATSPGLLSGSYVDVGEADNYFLSRFNSDLWVQTDVETKEKLLRTATRYIDRLNFKYDKTDPAQELEFPRNEETVVPQSIKNATCEISYALLDGRDVDYESASLNTESFQLMGVKLRDESDWLPTEKIHGIPSRVAWRFLRPFLRSVNSFKIERVS